jgi:signal transduction histidine kinase
MTRTPLVRINTYAQLLPSRGTSEEFRDLFSRTAAREIGRIDDVLERFRPMSRASHHPVETTDVSAPGATRSRRSAPRRRTTRSACVRSATGRAVRCSATRLKLQQLFVNLCLNAIQAKPGGELTVREADLSEGSGRTLIVEVADTGPGIPDDLLATVFDPFVATPPHGTSLGLATCRGIADAHHTRLGAHTHVGRPGCPFPVEFPVSWGRPVRVAP